MKYKIIGCDPGKLLSHKIYQVTHELAVVFYDDDGNYLGEVRPRHAYETNERLDVIGNKNLRLNVLSYKKEPIDTGWIAFGPQSSEQTGSP